MRAVLIDETEVQTPGALNGTLTAREDEHDVTSIVKQQLDVLAAESRKKKRGYWLLTGLMLSVFAVSALLSIASRGHFSTGPFIWVFVSTGAALRAMSRNQRSAAAVLAKHDDLRAVGAMCEMVNLTSKNGGTELVSAFLKRTLPRLRASDAPLITSAQLKCLHSYLYGRRRRVDVELALAILTALEQVGNTDSVAAVRDLASGNGAGARSNRIRSRAVECLGGVQAAAERQLAGESLLRASSAADQVFDSGDGLLRPAANAPTQEAADQLVRASGRQD